MSFNNIDSNDNLNSILIIVIIEISIIIRISVWNSKSFEKKWRLKKVKGLEEIKILVGNNILIH